MQTFDNVHDAWKQYYDDAGLNFLDEKTVDTKWLSFSAGWHYGKDFGRDEQEVNEKISEHTFSPKAKRTILQSLHESQSRLIHQLTYIDGDASEIELDIAYLSTIIGVVSKLPTRSNQ